MWIELEEKHQKTNILPRHGLKALTLLKHCKRFIRKLPSFSDQEGGTPTEIPCYLTNRAGEIGEECRGDLADFPAKRWGNNRNLKCRWPATRVESDSEDEEGN